MSNYYRPKKLADDGSKLMGVLFTSRNKDNNGLDGFRPRYRSFLTRQPIDSDELNGAFDRFVAEGLPMESCRFYVSVNARDNDKVRKAMMHALIDCDDIDMASIGQMAVSLAFRKENASERKWMFDVDTKDVRVLDGLLDEINRVSDSTGVPNQVTVNDTPNGWHVITEHGFDTRGVDMTGIELKRDALTLVRCAVNAS